jgi:hypothetical protein
LKHRKFTLVILLASLASLAVAAPSNSRPTRHLPTSKRTATTTPAKSAATIPVTESTPQVLEAPSAPGASPVIGDSFDVFNYSSRPGAKKIIFLDFDGATVSNTDWNTSLWGGEPRTVGRVYPAGGLIKAVWSSVAEDFAPFDVNVTTRQPTDDALNRSTPQDDTFGITVIFTSDNVVCPRTCNGASIPSSFGVPRKNTVWIFAPNPFDGHNVASHELGHTLGLLHHGTVTSEYFSPIAGWAPIMGLDPLLPNGPELTQWSRGDYPSAGRPGQDDIELIAQQLGRISDSNTSIATAGSVKVDPAPESYREFTSEHIISRDTDHDFFAVDVTNGYLKVRLQRVFPGSNLVPRLAIVDSSGATLKVGVPNPMEPMFLTVEADLANGRHYVEVSGVGRTGAFSAYGSLGYYQLVLSKIDRPEIPRMNYVQSTGQRELTAAWYPAISRLHGPVSYA